MHTIFIGTNVIGNFVIFKLNNNCVDDNISTLT